MYNAADRVEFFQSESSFGSESSLNNSRYYDFTNEIIAETDNLMLSLKKQLLPNEQLSQQDKVKYVLSRAQILYKDTIPQHLAYLNKIQAPANAKSQVKACSDKLGKLLSDYDSLKNKTMIYKQFFNIYGKEFGYNPQASFVKGQRLLCVQDENEAVLQPECVQINYNNSRAKLKATPRVLMPANPPSNDKQVNALREEVYLLKKAIEDIKKKQDMELISERLMAQKRIRTYLKAKVPSQGEDYLSSIQAELEQYSFKLSCLEEENKALKEQLEENSKAAEVLKTQNNSYMQEIEHLRKRDINLDEEDVHDKSYTSEMNQKEDKRNEKKIKILLHENQLLKNQLKSQRQRIYRLTSDLTEEERRQLQTLQKQAQKKNADIEQLYGDLDKQRIQILQLTHNNNVLTKMNESMKQENEEFKKQLKNMDKEHNVNIYPLHSVHQIQPSMVMSRKLQVLEYEGEGIEGLPYFQLLSKEFKIRYKRACLKEKELLHKANGLQIGVISQFQKPNKLSLLLHLTNYGECAFKRVKGKLLNANDNKIAGETFDYSELAEGDQVKVPVSLLITNYPLGPLILALEYQTDKREELRILLPAHIFKMFEFEERSEAIKKPEKIIITTERKIVKSLQDCRQYFKAGKIEDSILKISAFHRHTHTEVHLNVSQTKEGIELHYSHYEGNINITQYFIRTLTFLLKK